MDLRPEQQRALDYLRRKGTDADPEHLHQHVTRLLRSFEEVLATIDADAARKRPAEGRWCVQEVVDHLVESHRPGVDQLDAALAGRSTGEAIPAGLQSADPMGRNWRDLVDDLRKVHDDFLDVMARGTAETSLESEIPVVLLIKVRAGEGTPRPVEWIEDLDWKAYALALGVHTREHQDQVRRVLEA